MFSTVLILSLASPGLQVEVALALATASLSHSPAKTVKKPPAVKPGKTVTSTYKPNATVVRRDRQRSILRYRNAPRMIYTSRVRGSC